jgi:hypothetical protein
VGNHDGSIRPDQRLVELARILAGGVSRLHLAAQRVGTGQTASHSPDSANFSATLAPIPLERSRATGVTVGRVVNRGEAIDLGSDLTLFEQEASTWL